MWIVKNNNELVMAEKDWGITLPVVVSGTTLTTSDVLKFTFKKKKNGETILEKEYTPIQNTANFDLSETETDLFPAGEYVYSLDWYQDGAFMCNIIAAAFFKVVDKA